MTALSQYLRRVILIRTTRTRAVGRLPLSRLALVLLPVQIHRSASPIQLPRVTRQHRLSSRSTCMALKQWQPHVGCKSTSLGRVNSGRRGFRQARDPCDIQGAPEHPRVDISEYKCAKHYLFIVTRYLCRLPGSLCLYLLEYGSHRVFVLLDNKLSILLRELAECVKTGT